MRRATLSLLVLAGCRYTTTKIAPYSAPDAKPEAVVPGYVPAIGYKLSESQIASITVCADSLGVNTLNGGGGSCLPCIPGNTFQTGEGARRHATRLWRHIGRAPHDVTYPGSVCTDIAYHLARIEAPEDPTVVVEATLFRLASANDSLRAFGLARLDATLDSILARGDTALVGSLLEQFGRGVWERAQRQLERPNAEQLHDWEAAVHDLTDGAPTLRRIPRIPRTSDRVGVSEAEWSARIFDAASRLLATPEDRSRVSRLALSPWVTMTRWNALDSAAKAMLDRSAGDARADSALLPARALAAYKGITRPVLEQPGVWARFDSLVRALPRVDSARYDSFDGTLTAADDEWRYGFLPAQLKSLDHRGWLVLDPIWSTEVNELRLARRARVAEADYRFADLAKPGAAGSETVPGSVWLRRGTLSPAFVLRRSGYDWELQRGWGGDRVALKIAGVQDMWRGFYTGHFAPEKIVQWPAADGCDGPSGILDFLECTRSRRADWTGVPFWGETDTIDVALARFRAARDSVDVYVGARLPLRRFRFREDTRARKDDRIRFGLWITTALGAPLHRSVEERELPKEDVLAWTTQWRPRIGVGDVMHRVEALEPARPTAARGVHLYTSDSQVEFALAGFGMSDILLAATATPSQGSREANRWSELTVTPNGGVIAPRQSFALAWETYDLATAKDGLMHWRVTVHRETGRRDQRDDMRAMMRGDRQANDKVLAVDSEVPALEYTRVAQPASTVVDNIRFNLNDVPAGRHVVLVRVEDLTTGKVTARSVSVRVLPPKAQERAQPPAPGTVRRTPPAR